jgi:nitrogen fixation NifU-like protein
MSDLRELYQSVILDHNRKPRNYGPLADAGGLAEGRNPLCGDNVTVWVKTEGERVTEIGFVGEGCAISRASASIMTTVLKGQTQFDAVALADEFQSILTGASARPADGTTTAALRPVAPLLGVSRFPQRVKCATLAWHAFRTALEQAIVETRRGGARPPTPAGGEP